MGNSIIQTNQRDTFVDVMRGIAMLLVVLGHTMTGCTTGSQNSFLFNVIWSLQMPLFILISGYVTKYSRGCQNSQSLWRYMKRRTIAYLFPWVVWTFLVRGMIFGQHSFLEIGWVVYNLDSGYWFLITIWTISVFFGLAEYLSRNVANKQVKILVTGICFGIFGMALALVGWKLGLNFMGIKLTLYYMPFYLMGYLWGKYSDTISNKKWGSQFISIMIAVSTIVWMGIIANVELFTLQDGGIDVVLRVLCSVTGCISICGLTKGLFDVGSQQSQTNGGVFSMGRSPLNGNICGPISAAKHPSTTGETDVRFNTRNNADISKLSTNNGLANDSNQVAEPKHTSTLYPIRKVLMEFFEWAGVNSLQLYLIHTLVINLLRFGTTPSFKSVNGLLLIMGNYVLSIVLLMMIINLINTNRYLKWGLFGTR